jgi:hypothetical protein
MAARIFSVGLVTVSLLRSIMTMAYFRLLPERRVYLRARACAPRNGMGSWRHTSQPTNPKESTMTARTLVLALCLSALPAEASTAFRFRIPDGFRDLSPGLADATFAGLPEAIVSEARSGKYVAFGMDLREEDGFYENFNAVVQPGALKVSEDFASEHKAMLPVEYSKLLGGPVAVIEHGIATLGGVPVVRAVYDVQSPDLPMRQMQYMIPGGNEEWAILTYTATPQTFDRYLPIFEASAAATQGAQETKLFDFGRVGKGALFGAGIGLVVGLVAQLAKGRKKAAKPAPRRMAGRPARPVARR